MRHFAIVGAAIIASLSAFDTEAAVSREAALEAAIENAGIPKRDIFNLKVEPDEESGVAVYSIEFETEYGDFDFCVARSDGRIIDADAEVDEAWIRRQPDIRNAEEAIRKEVVRRVPGASALKACSGTRASNTNSKPMPEPASSATGMRKCAGKRVKDAHFAKQENKLKYEQMIEREPQKCHR